jgi:drug/metabolite transporter (DMT)-like permease
MGSEMWRFFLFGFGLLLLFDTSAQVCLKLAAEAAAPFALDTHWVWRALQTPWLYAAIGSYLGAFFSWMGLLERAPVGPAFAASHLDVVSVLVISAILFREPIGVPQLIGSACICFGILFLSASARGTEAGSR